PPSPTLLPYTTRFRSALTALVATSAKSADALAKSADSMGLTTEALAGIRYAAKEAGIDAEIFEKKLATATKNIGDAATKGIGAAAESIKMPGLDATKLAEMSPDQQLNAISDAMA